MEPNREHMRLWVEALRSGRYEQTTGRLRGETGYCCLGVACDISGLADWAEAGSDEYPWSYGGAEEILPDGVAEWLGVEDVSPMVFWELRDTQEELASLNDEGRTFAEIADAIEKEWLA